MSLIVHYFTCNDKHGIEAELCFKHAIDYVANGFGEIRSIAYGIYAEDNSNCSECLKSKKKLKLKKPKEPPDKLLRESDEGKKRKKRS